MVSIISFVSEMSYVDDSSMRQRGQQVG